jgi:DNA polymerase III subunit delta'
MTAPMRHTDQEMAFVEAACSGRLHHAWLLTGPKGVGKADFARQAARFLLTDCDMAQRNPAPSSLESDETHRAAALIDAASHPDFMLIEREASTDKKGLKSGDVASDDAAAKSITIAQIRGLLVRTRIRPSDSRWRCIIINSVDDLERSGANALLKTLEEPPDNTIFFLISHAPGRLLPTIRSRCRLLRFSQSSEVGSESSNRQSSAASSGALYEHAHPSSVVGMDDIVATLTSIAHRGDSTGAQRVELAKSTTGSANRHRMVAMLEVSQKIAARLAVDAERAYKPPITLHHRLIEIARYAVTGAEDSATVAFLVGDAFVQFYEQSQIELSAPR